MTEGVLARKDWNPERVVRVVTAILVAWMCSILIAGAVSGAMRSKGQSMSLLASLVVVGIAFHGFGLVAVAFLLRQERRTWTEAFGFDRQWRRSVTFGVGCLLVVAPGIYLLHAGVGEILPRLGIQPDVQAPVRMLMESDWKDRIVIGFFAVVLAPIVEELLFRGIFFPMLRDLGFQRLAWWGTSLVFGFIHGNVAAFLPLCVLGAFFAWLYQRTGNLASSIAAHALFNVIPFVLVSCGIDLSF